MLQYREKTKNIIEYRQDCKKRENIYHLKYAFENIFII